MSQVEDTGRLLAEQNRAAAERVVDAVTRRARAEIDPRIDQILERLDDIEERLVKLEFKELERKNRGRGVR